MWSFEDLEPQKMLKTIECLTIKIDAVNKVK